MGRAGSGRSGGTPAKRGRFLDAYRSVRKPLPPPERVEEDRRREIDERVSRREADEVLVARRRRAGKGRAG